MWARRVNHLLSPATLYDQYCLFHWFLVRFFSFSGRWTSSFIQSYKRHRQNVTSHLSRASPTISLTNDVLQCLAGDFYKLMLISPGKKRQLRHQNCLWKIWKVLLILGEVDMMKTNTTKDPLTHVLTTKHSTNQTRKFTLVWESLLPLLRLHRECWKSFSVMLVYLFSQVCTMSLSQLCAFPIPKDCYYKEYGKGKQVKQKYFFLHTFTISNLK